MLTSVLNLWEATVWLLKQRFDGIGNEILNTCVEPSSVAYM